MSLRRLVLEIIEEGRYLGCKYISEIRLHAYINNIDLLLVCDDKKVKFEAFSQKCDVHGNYLEFGSDNRQSRLEFIISKDIENSFTFRTAFENYLIMLGFWRYPCCHEIIRKSDGISWNLDTSECWTMNSVKIEKCPVCRKFMPDIFIGTDAKNRFSQLVDRLD